MKRRGNASVGLESGGSPARPAWQALAWALWLALLAPTAGITQINVPAPPAASTSSTDHRPQDPQKPFPYREEEVTYSGKQPGVRLAGTLTLPKGRKKAFPAVLLVTGSGPQDRNETMLGHRPFLVLADYLTRRGIAVLRVDDRGVGGSYGASGSDTSASYAGDVQAGIEYLATRKDIDPTRIGLLGHSEGGMIAPMVASKSSGVAFVVLMAAPGVKGEDLLEEQAALVAKARGASDEMIAMNREMQKKMFTLVLQGKDYIATETELRELWGQAKDKMSADDIRAMGDPDVVARQQIRAVMTPWFRYFLSYDPREALEHTHCPVLAINGELDLQVPARQNLPAIEAALKSGGNPDVTITELPRLNHLFQTAPTGSPAEYAGIDETLSPVALKTMGDWIVAHTRAL
jgi:pimeloyl-ACP methyl ester carboxylesterase